MKNPVKTQARIYTSISQDNTQSDPLKSCSSNPQSRFISSGILSELLSQLLNALHSKLEGELTPQFHKTIPSQIHGRAVDRTHNQDSFSLEYSLNFSDNF